MISKAKREKTLHLVAVCDELQANAEKLKKKALALLDQEITREEGWDLLIEICEAKTISTHDEMNLREAIFDLIDPHLKWVE